jgi:hypothetical protein
MKYDLVDYQWKKPKSQPRSGLIADHLLAARMKELGIKVENPQQTQNYLRAHPAVIEDLLAYLEHHASECSSQSARECRATLLELKRYAKQT